MDKKICKCGAEFTPWKYANLAFGPLGVVMGWHRYCPVYAKTSIFNFWAGRKHDQGESQIEKPVEVEKESNPRGYCPDCGADLGRFYSNRVIWRG